MQISLFDNPVKPQIELHELFEAYFACRKNKRNTANAIAFEVDYESNLVQLCKELNEGTYQISRSIAFMIQDPVHREIFAADFRDRIVHHLIIGKLNPLFEKQFIYDSYACREGKGTHFGIQRVAKFIRRNSQNYTKDCYILKLDIQGFFMHIDKSILFGKLEKFIKEKYQQSDKALILKLSQQVIFNDCKTNCIIKGKLSNWEHLPKTKSLFHSQQGCGLPIGNLTSQIFANFYMDNFDHFIKHELGIKYYGRYVDDFIIVHQDKAYLKTILYRITDYLKMELNLTIHPKKIYLQQK
jgi:RNA-directed DNA polymerase